MCVKKNEIKFHRGSLPENFRAIFIVLILISCVGFLFFYVDSAISACGTCPGDQCDSDCDGIPDSKENILGTNRDVKTLFVRPILETSSSNQQYGAFFIDLFDPPNPPYSTRNPNGTINIPAFAGKNIEIRVIGDSYPKNYCSNPPDNTNCLNSFNYNPAQDSNCPNCRILEIIYDTHSLSCKWGNHNNGHIYFDNYRVTWSWDTKGYTLPSTQNLYGKPYIYEIPLKNYFNEGPYKSIQRLQGPQSQTDWRHCSTLNLCDNLRTPYPSPNCLPPDQTVEFNPIVFNRSMVIRSLPPEPRAATPYNLNQVLMRTIIHEMGHALLAGQDTDHGADKNCIMYSGVEDWKLNNFGPGSCEHNDGRSLDIGAAGVVYNGP